MSIELLLLAVNLNFAAFSIYLDDIVGQIFIIFVLMVAAAESAVGLAILTVFYRLRNSILFESVKKKNSPQSLTNVFREKRDLNPQSST